MSHRIVSEVQIHSRLEHDTVVPLLDFEEDERYVYLVLPRATCNLAEVLVHVLESKETPHSGDSGLPTPRESKGRKESVQNATFSSILRPFPPTNNSPAFPEPDVVSLLREVVGGVAYLHSHGIIHRDIKLTNLLIAPSEHSEEHSEHFEEHSEGGSLLLPFRVLIADFGLAIQLETPDSASATRCGTPNYMAPEVALALPHTSAVDVWGIGVVAYTLLTGFPPFGGSGGALATMAKVKRGTFTIPDWISPSARSFIEACLARKPSSRPRANDLLHHPFLATSKSTPTPTPTPSPPLRVKEDTVLEQLDTTGIQSLHIERTSYGYISILPDGDVGVDVEGENLVLLIAPDGSSVRVSHKESNRVATYSLEEVSQDPKLREYYAAAAEYVAASLAVTAQITFHTGLGVFSLLATGTYTGTFGDGFQIKYSPGHDAYTLDGESTVPASLTSSLSPEQAARVAVFDAARERIDAAEADPEVVAYPYVFYEGKGKGGAKVRGDSPARVLFNLSGISSSSSSSASFNSSTLSVFSGISSGSSSSSSPSHGRGRRRKRRKERGLLAEPVWMEGVGWAFRDGLGAMRILFTSGAQLAIPSAAKTVSVALPGDDFAVYSLGVRVPDHVRVLLQHVPDFVQKMARC